MKSNLLLNKIQLIQNEYKVLLKSLLPKLKSIRAPEALDEINLFWLRHIDEIQLYLQFWFHGDSNYVFTAATYMDYDDKEHLPFLLMGDKHVLDDPLSKYSEICNKMSEDENTDFLYKQIEITAEDNLKILENLQGEILILPLRIFNQQNDNKTFFSLGEQTFVGLFNGIKSLNDYFSKCINFDDILHYARNDIDCLLMFSEDDDMSLPLKDRFEIALTKTEFMIDIDKPDSYNFFMLVFGYIQQAIDIIISCIEYGCIPYIRYPVSLHYIYLLTEKMTDVEHIKILRLKMGIAFIVYQLCDKEKLSFTSLDNFIRLVKNYNFYDKLIITLQENGIDTNNIYNHDISKYIILELEKLYSLLSTNYDT